MKNGRDHQGTPRGVFAWAARRWGPFDLDPAASPWNAKCPDFYTESLNGLARSWEGRVWCNPPWQDIQPWVAKAVDEVREGNAEIVVMLLPTRTGSEWWMRYARLASAIIYIRGRVKFDAPPGMPTGSGGFEDCAFLVFERPPNAKDMR